MDETIRESMIVLKIWQLEATIYEKKYVSATMDWTLKIEVSGRKLWKNFKRSNFDCTHFWQGLISLSPLIVKTNCWRAS